MVVTGREVPMKKRTFRPAPSSSVPGYPTLEEYARRRLLGLAGGVLLGAGVVSACVTSGEPMVPDLVDGGVSVPGKDGGGGDASMLGPGGVAPSPDSGPVPDAAEPEDAGMPLAGAAPSPDSGPVPDAAEPEDAGMPLAGEAMPPDGGDW
jgi:hypothetical protein